MLKRLARAFSRRPAPIATRSRPAPATPFARLTTRLFEGATISRLTASWRTPIASIDADLAAALPLLRARSRDLCANTPLGRRFIKLVERNVVGATGFAFQSKALNVTSRGVESPDAAGNLAVERAWAKWGRVGGCDVTGKLSFRQLCVLVIACVARDGEAIVRRVRGADNAHGYALQVIDPDRLDVTYNVRNYAGTTRDVRMGVELDDMGRPVAYHLLTWHPADGKMTKRERIPARDVFHVFVPDRPEQTRGVPWLHAALMTSKQLDAFEDAATIAARIGASKMGFFKTNVDPQEAAALMASAKESESSPVKPGEPQDPTLRQDPAPKYVMGVEPGQFDVLPPGWDLATFDAQFPDEAFDPFVKALMRRISSGLDIAYHNLSGDLSAVNYSSARIGELDEREMWKTVQQWLIEAFVLPCNAEWLNLATLKGAIKFPDGKALPGASAEKFADAASFRGRRWAWVDPEKEINAHVNAIHNGLRSRTNVVADEGLEFDDVIAQLAEEQRAIAAAKIPVEAPKANTPSAPARDPAETDDPAAADAAA